MYLFDMKRYILVLLSFLMLLSSYSYSQSQGVEGIKKSLSTAKEDSSKVRLLNELVHELSYGDKYEALPRVYQSIALAKRISFDDGLYDAYDLLGVIYLDKGILDSAEIFMLKALRYYEKKDDQQSLFKIYQNLGHVHVQRGSFENAESYYSKEYAIAKRLGDHRLMGNAHNDKASLYINIGWNSIEVKNDTVAQMNYFEKAVPHIHKAIGYFKQAEYERGVALAYGNLAILQEEMYELDASKQSMQAAMAYFERMNYTVYLVSAYNHFNKIYQKMGLYDSALFYLEKSLDLSRVLESKIDTRNVYGQFSSLYVQLGDFEKALFYHHQYDELNDQILSESKQATIDELEVAYATNRRDHDLALSELENKKQKIVIVSGAILMIALMLMMFFFWKKGLKEKKLNIELAQKSAQLKKSNLLIAQQNAQLTESYNELNNLTAVVAHDLRTPLNNLKALNSLVKMSGSLNSEQHELHDKSLQVIEGGESLINDIVNLTRIENVAEVSFEELYLNSWMAEEIEIHAAYAEQKNISFEMRASKDQIYLVTDKESLTRIMDNLLSNAIKFSNPSKRVLVMLQDTGDDVTISVTDQGPGMTDEDVANAFQRFKKLSARPTGGENSTGLGLSIVKTLVEKLGGTITIESQLGVGTTFHMRLAHSKGNEQGLNEKNRSGIASV
ncbi:hypothetical protein BGP76_07080 [Reichenbachiella sp. MSK19-1]|nr:hypothetical protein BGP76_07080 [Reichenbachiella sp. MSK19-1]